MPEIVKPKRWYKSWTVWMNVLLGIGAVSTLPLAPVIGAAAAAKIGLAGAVANIVVRVAKTGQPIGNPDADPQQ